jgi:membrane protease YdiL (CAAX protease family)
MIVFTWLWMWLWEGRAPWTVGLERDGAAMKYLRGLALGFLSFTAVVGLLALTGSVELEGGDPSQQGLGALGGVVIVFIGWVVQGATEEVVTRGWLMQTLGIRYKAWVGILVSSLVFTVLHGLNPNLSLTALLNLTLFGVFAAFYALREGSLWGICAYHSVWNWVQGNFFGLEVSGIETSGGILLNMMETGNDLWTGGAFGPEGGLVVTVVLLVSMLVVFFVKIPPRAVETPI